MHDAFIQAAEYAGGIGMYEENEDSDIYQKRIEFPLSQSQIEALELKSARGFCSDNLYESETECYTNKRHYLVQNRAIEMKQRYLSILESNMYKIFDLSPEDWYQVKTIIKKKLAQVSRLCPKEENACSN